MRNGPCTKECPDRTITCHGECLDYLKYTGERQEVYKERKARNDLLFSFSAFREAGIKRNTGHSSPYLKCH